MVLCEFFINNYFSLVPVEDFDLLYNLGLLSLLLLLEILIFLVYKFG